MKQKKVSIIIPTYNGLNFLKKCILAIGKQIYKNIETIIVDNNSSDQTVSYVKKNYPQTIIIENKTNNGFAKANNQGANKASGEFLFFLNNDTELFSDAVEQLVTSYKPFSVLSAYQIPSRDKKLPGQAGAGMDIFGYSCQEKDLSKTKIFYADGVALFIKKLDFIKLGMFDEKLFMFQEDVDLSWRAQISGLKIIQCFKAKLYHYYGGTALLDINQKKKYVTSYFRRYLNEKNVIRNLIKNYSLTLLIPILMILFVFHFFEILIFILTFNFKTAQCYLKAYVWNIVYLPDTLRTRAKIQKQRMVSDLKLVKKMYWHYTKFKLFLKMGFPQLK